MPQNTVINQIFKVLSRSNFQRQVRKFGNDKGVKSFNSWQQFKVLMYAQIRQLSSLREIVSSLRCHGTKLYHLGLKTVSRSTLADANSRRGSECFQAMFYSVLEECHRVAPGHRMPMKRSLYSLDATVISLSLSLFPWAKFRQRKGGIKLHTLLDHAGHMPAFMVMTDAATHDSRIATDKSYGLPQLPPGSILVMDKAYNDFHWMQQLDDSKVGFVTRAKKNLKFRIVKRNTPRREAGIITDHHIKLTGACSKTKYSGILRLIKFRDNDSGKMLVFLTNNLELAATTISRCYKERWQIELFFKWIKQHLKIKTFIGTSQNAVMTQVWVAMIYYLLISYLKFLSKTSYTMLDLVRIMKELALEVRDLYQLLLPEKRKPPEAPPNPQLTLM